MKDSSFKNQQTNYSRFTFYDFSNSSFAVCKLTKQAPHNVIQNLVFSRAVLGAMYQYEQPMIVSFAGNRLPIEMRAPLVQLQKNQGNNLHILNYPQGVLADACLDKVVFNRFIGGNPLCPPTLVLDLTELDNAAIHQFLRVHPNSPVCS